MACDSRDILPRTSIERAPEQRYLLSVSDDQTLPHRQTGAPIRTLRVEVVQGPDAGLSKVASSNVIGIGTAEDNDLVLTDNTVSRYHANVEHRGDRIAVIDHESTNGTLIGRTGIHLERALVPVGTVLMLGKSQIRVDGGDTIDVELHDSDTLGPLRGRAPEMLRLMAQIRRAAQSDVSVLLLGETGVGKEVAARAIHESSGRAEGPFETVDCGALAPTLIASELFGHEKGAFTSADRQYIGAFERAHGGTLFLDEIGELPSSLQTVLLGALERRSFRRVGGTQKIDVDVRVVSATNRDLKSEVNSGRFRQDLFYRIAVLKLAIPPLRDRGEDIPLLVEHFLREIGHDGSVEEIIPRSAMEAMKEHRWPGNVRELRNFVEAAIAMGEAPAFDPEDATPPRSEAASKSEFPSVPFDRLLKLSYKDARSKVLDEFEALFLADLISRTKGNVSEAARESKIHRSYLIQMLKRHGLK
jgi:DNA-binding NtrC family response regulator